jgi:hypothetical protein
MVICFVAEMPTESVDVDARCTRNVAFEALRTDLEKTYPTRIEPFGNRCFFSSAVATVFHFVPTFC